VGNIALLDIMVSICIPIACMHIVGLMIRLWMVGGRLRVVGGRCGMIRSRLRVVWPRSKWSWFRHHRGRERFWDGWDGEGSIWLWFRVVRREMRVVGGFFVMVALLLMMVGPGVVVGRGVDWLWVVRGGVWGLRVVRGRVRGLRVVRGRVWWLRDIRTGV